MFLCLGSGEKIFIKLFFYLYPLGFWDLGKKYLLSYFFYLYPLRFKLLRLGLIVILLNISFFYIHLIHFGLSTFLSFLKLLSLSLLQLNVSIGNPVFLPVLMQENKLLTSICVYV